MIPLYGPLNSSRGSKENPVFQLKVLNGLIMLSYTI